MAETTVVNVRGMDTFDLRHKRITLIDRRSMFGNPFRIGPDGDREQVICLYQSWLQEKVRIDPAFRKALLKLRGKKLGCWCAPQPCHGDVIVRWLEANT